MTIFIRREELTNRKITGLLQKTDVFVIGADCREEKWEWKSENPEGKIWLYHSLVSQDGEQIPFEQLLLDERYSDGEIVIPEEALEQCGYCNEKLQQKRIYEWLLRLALKYPVIGRKTSANVKRMPEESQNNADLENSLAINTVWEEGGWQNYQADCYIAAKYSDILKSTGYFDAVIGELIQRAEESTDKEQAVSYLKEMLSHGKQYEKLVSATAPILVYYGATYCYNIMNTMLGQFAQALRMCGERVWIYEESAENLSGIGKYVDRRFKAIIGIQSYLFQIYMKEAGGYLHDRIFGPKFNMILDHPVWLLEQLSDVPEDYYVLTHDVNYCNFIKQYYPRVKGSYLFPPGGMQLQQTQLKKRGYETRTYGIVFVGTYGDYRKKCGVIRQCIPRVRFLANRFLLMMRKMPWLTAEAAFEKTLRYYGIPAAGQDFFQIFYEFRAVIQCVMYYYREKVIKTLLDAGLSVDVWGDSWGNAPFAEDPNLKIHQEVTPEESLKIFEDARVSLNIMAWHKGGFTERMASSMLSGAVLLTDETTYNDGELENGRQCVMFSLSHLENLPQIAKKLLEDKAWSGRIAQNGYEYARKKHTWEKRAKQFLEILDKL